MLYLHVTAGLLFLAAGLVQIMAAAQYPRITKSRSITHWVLGTAMIFHAITHYLIN